MKEIWKKIENFEDYQISSLGRIKSLKWNKERILKYRKIRGNYYKVSLYNKNKCKEILVHVLVANAFLNKEDFKFMNYEMKNKIDLDHLEVNHIDGNKFNNNVNNLEWCTKSYNQKHSYDKGLKKIRRDYNNNLSKHIIQYDLEGNFIKEWANKRTIERELGYGNGNISACCKGKNKTSYGYVWKYKEDNNVD